MLTQWFRPEVNIPSSFVPWSCDMAEKLPDLPLCVVDPLSSVIPAASNRASFSACAALKMSWYFRRSSSASLSERMPSLMNSAKTSCHFFSSSEYVPSTTDFRMAFSRNSSTLAITSSEPVSKSFSSSFMPLLMLSNDVSVMASCHCCWSSSSVFASETYSSSHSDWSYFPLCIFSQMSGSSCSLARSSGDRRHSAPVSRTFRPR